MDHQLTDAQKRLGIASRVLGRSLPQHPAAVPDSKVATHLREA